MVVLRRRWNVLKTYKECVRAGERWEIVIVVVDVGVRVKTVILAVVIRRWI